MCVWCAYNMYTHTFTNGYLVVCLGFNALHCARTSPPDQAEEHDTRKEIPHVKRVWNWLVLCEDSECNGIFFKAFDPRLAYFHLVLETVISIAEDPFPFSNGNLRAYELKMLVAVRRNLVNVFKQLSKAQCSSRESSVNTLPIRKRVGDTEEETAHRPTDSPGLLFYYLFEDWYTTYSLVTRREHQYAAELDKLVGLHHSIAFHKNQANLMGLSAQRYAC